MISLKPLFAQLTPKPAGFAHPWFRAVDGAASYAKLPEVGLPLPGCWIVRASDPSEAAGERATNTRVEFDVVIAIENARTHEPGEMDEVLLDYRLAVTRALLGWEMEPGVRPLKFKGGRVLAYTDADLFWADRYYLDALITNYLPDPPAYAGLTNTGEN